MNASLFTNGSLAPSAQVFSGPAINYSKITANPGVFQQGFASGQTLGGLNNQASALGGAAAALGQKAFAQPNPVTSALAGQSAAAEPVWNFIVAPEDISWDTAVATNRVDMFGTNAPPVVVGTKGMRELSLSNAMIEGFTRARTVEGRVHALEKLMRFTLNTAGGFVNVPVYQVFANAKSYGNANQEEGGYFVIKDVKIKETMRDLQGKSTRAFADISLIQVPDYQVNTGRDQASATVNSATSLLGNAGSSVSAAATQGVAQTKPAAGSAAATPAPAPKAQAAPPAAPKTAPSAAGSTARPSERVPFRSTPLW